MNDDPVVMYRMDNVGDDIVLRQYPVCKTTPKGVWISTNEATPDKMRFVLKEGTKRFAHETVAGAAASFLWRKRAQLKAMARDFVSIAASIKHAGLALDFFEQEMVRVTEVRLDGGQANPQTYFSAFAAGRINKMSLPGDAVEVAMDKALDEAMRPFAELVKVIVRREEPEAPTDQPEYADVRRIL